MVARVLVTRAATDAPSPLALVAEVIEVLHGKSKGESANFLLIGSKKQSSGPARPITNLRFC